MELLRARREQALIRLAIQGPSGSGKTFSSLLLAYGLVGDWNQIVVIDTEHNSSHLYSHLGQYDVLSLSKPFSPERFIEAIETCEKAGKKVIIIDSISHEWSGEGGILDVHGNLPGNSFTNWAKITPRHNAFVQKMLQSPCHIIGNIRVKQDYVLTEKNGKMVPEKVGLQGVTREDLGYEFTIMFDIDIKHNAVASKDRTNLFSDKPQFIISEATGELIRNWCQGGIKVSDIETEIENCQTIEGLRHILTKYQQHRNSLEPAIYRRKAQIETLAAAVTT
ncbi:MAG: AAA family ATPase [Bacteroidales bacterium]|nr:AAA family ATPase [Bacteroidales bacterium]